MKIRLLWSTILAGLLTSTGPANATDVTMKISGPGAINDSTIVVGKTVSVDIYWANDKERKGFTTGFAIRSDDIETIIHVADSGAGLNKGGDIKGYNGWEDKSVWDLGGIFTAMRDWDGLLPDNIGFGAAVVKKRYLPHENKKVLSFDIIVPTPGTIVIDSAFFAPGGYWKFGSNEQPTWDGPYTYKVVVAATEKAADKAEKKSDE